MLAIVLSAIYMQMLDTTITLVATPAIQADLGASFGSIQLVVAGYSLAFAVVLITSGRLGDIIGRKRMFMIGMAGFTLASALCGAAPNASFLVAARVFQGLCSGLMFPQVLSIIQVSFSDEDKPKAFNLYGASIGLATVTGPVLGGFLTDLDIFGLGWRSIFYINVPIGLWALTASAMKLRESTAPNARRLDLWGASISAVGVFLLVLPLVIGREHGWPLWCFALLAASVPVLALFAWYEVRLTGKPGASPVAPASLFRERSFTFGLMSLLFFFTGIASFFFTLFLTLQVGFSYSPLSAGAVTFFFAFMIAVASARSSEVVKRIGTSVLLVGTALLVVAMVGVLLTVAYVGPDLHAYQLIPIFLVGGAGAGLFLAPCTSIILAGIKSGDVGAASGMLATIQQVGLALGIAVIGIIFFGLLGHNADDSSGKVISTLRADLAKAGVSAPAAQQVVTGFETCFRDRAHAKDPSSTPGSCQRIQQEIAANPAPPQVKAAVQQAVLEKALPQARKQDFSHSFWQALFWQITVFSLAFLFALGLPKVKPTSPIPTVA